MERTANHPFLLQLIASRLFESHDLAATLDQVAADEMVSNFFSVDFQTLEARRARASSRRSARDGPRRRREELAQARRAARDDAAEPLLFGLRMMGYLSRGERPLPHRQLVLRALAAPRHRREDRSAAVIA